MADDGSNYGGGDDDGGLAEREAALKRCAASFRFYFIFFVQLAEDFDVFYAPRGEKERKDHEHAQRERHEKR